MTGDDDRLTATHAPTPRASCRFALPSNRCSGHRPAGRPAVCSWCAAWMMAKSPSTRIFTSSAFRFLIVTGTAVCFRNAGAVDQRLVGIGAIEILRQNFVEAFDVAILHRGDIVAIERGQFVDIVAHGFPPVLLSRHCEERSDEAIVSIRHDAGLRLLLREARKDGPHGSIFDVLIIKHRRRFEPAELALDQFGQSSSGVRSSSQGPTIWTPTGRPSGAKPVGIAVDGRPGRVAMPGQVS